MQTRRHARDISAALLAVVATSLLAVGSVAAHRQIVDPKGGDTLISGPIARPWVQAHCHAAALAGRLRSVRWRRGVPARRDAPMPVKRHQPRRPGDRPITDSAPQEDRAAALYGRRLFLTR